MKSNLWSCPKCKREFRSKNQVHSCVFYPIENHFKNKPYSKEIFENLKKEIEVNIGPLKIDSLPCCIHLISNYTFSGVWALKDRIRMDFRTTRKIKSKRILKNYNLFSKYYMNYTEIKTKKDIDKEFLSWIKEAYLGTNE